MGFMDKAKKLAEQAQEKLDEAQKQFSERQQGQGGQQGEGVRYDEHGRPIQDPPAGAAPPSPTPDAPSEPAAPEAAPPKGGADPNPDPFKPIQ